LTTSTSGAIRTLLLFRPYTGKTHQLRVAAKSVGLPLAGDPIYTDNNNNNNNSNMSPPSARTYLHATGLHIPASALRPYLSSSSSPSSDGGGDSYSDHGDLTVWCPPPFEPMAWPDDLVAQAGFRQVLQTLVEKHCDCLPLRELAVAAAEYIAAASASISPTATS
jgi:hypothetical protein